MRNGVARMIGRLLAVTVAGTLLTGLPGSAGASGAATGAASRAEDFTKLGVTHGVSRVLQQGCHLYPYSYHIKPPTSVWALEVHLIDPRFHQISSGAFISGDDKVSGHSNFRICKPVTRAGTFRIRAKLTYKDGYDSHEGFIKTSTFKLCRPPKHPGKYPCSKAQQTR